MPAQVAVSLESRAPRCTWVALRHGVLVGHDDKHVALYRRLEAEGKLADVVFVRLSD
jgi:hypothetical protein